MNGHHWLIRRNRVFYIRVRIPKYLIYLVNASEFRYSLKTYNYYEALAKLPKESYKIIKQQKQQRREWFLEHFDKIWENRHKFKLGTPYASVIVDGIIITSFACPYYGYAIDKISIGNLVKLWDNGFMFRGYPLIHYRRHHNSDCSSISYIKDRKIISYDYSYRQPPEEQYIPSRPVLQILKNLRRYQPDDLDNYRTVEELAEELF